MEVHMDEQVYENLKYIRKSLSAQLRGKYPYHNVPLRAKWEADGRACVVNTETGESSLGKGDAQHLRYAIITLLYDQIPQAIRTREYLKAAAEALRMQPRANEVPSPFQQQIWYDLLGFTDYNPALYVRRGYKGPVLYVYMGGYTWGELPIDEALQFWHPDTLRWELGLLYQRGAQMLEFLNSDGDWRSECEAIGACYEPLQEE
uniref:Uncharacterized protein n=1 Tax=Podoviridae sp. ctRnx2 TaxID=2826555 RepID=A0A8S5QT53_9CAUD|nr:MAG TPA: hypothetical protein [Podoviridae sp. ctRnx2]